MNHIPVNVAYYSNLVAQGSTSNKSRNFLNGIITNIKAKNNLATIKQFNTLEKFKNGSLKFK